MVIASVVETIEYWFTRAFLFVAEHPMYFIGIFIAIAAYAVASHIFFKARGYQPVDKGTCTLSLMGKERSLDYLKNFSHMPQEQLEIIQFMRANEPVSLGALLKRFGKHNVDMLIRQGYIVLI